VDENNQAERHRPTPRVMMIGLDAADWSLIETYVADGVMPNVDKLLNAGSFTKLEAERGFKAEGRWAEILTGRTAEENQYWSIVGFDPLTYTPYYERSCHGSYFYARPDLVSIVFDVPNSVIAEDAHGIQVTAWGSHAAQFPSASRPNHILPDIDRSFGVHEALLSDGHTGWHNDGYLDRLQSAMEKGIRQRVDISRWLREQRPDWDLFVTVFPETHVAEHQYLHGFVEDHPLHGDARAERAAERLRTTFARIDDAVGEMVADIDDHTTVVLFAAHGMEPNKSDVIGGVLVPEMLHRLAYGTPMIEFEPWTETDGYIELPEKVLARHYLEHRMTRPAPVTTGGLRGLAKRGVRRVRHQLPAEHLNTFERTYWRRPDWWEMHLREPAPYHSRDLLAEASRIELESVAASSWYRSHWPGMTAFVLPSFSDCHIRLNVKGRERDGVIEADDYHAACERVTDELRRLVDARTGRPIVDEVIRVRERDPMAEIGPAPDLIVTFTAVTDVVRHPDVGIIGPAPIMRAGEHTPHGWASIVTPGGDRNDLGSIEPRDLTATVSDLLGRPSSPLLTGTSVSDRINPRSTT
jgi:predicted AlkP superfamily phosphohydrolase/phosphomutase